MDASRFPTLSNTLSAPRLVEGRSTLEFRRVGPNASPPHSQSPRRMRWPRKRKTRTLAIEADYSALAPSEIAFERHLYASFAPPPLLRNPN